jgi:heme-degrading monooxygenase HmoA
MTTDTKFAATDKPEVSTPLEAKNIQKERRLVRVIIQHKSNDIEGLVDQLKEVRDEVMKFPGYITSEHLISADDPTSLFVISTWQNTERWHNWENSEVCKKLMERLSAKLTEPIKVSIFNYFVIREKRVWSTF